MQAGAFRRAAILAIAGTAIAAAPAHALTDITLSDSPNLGAVFNPGPNNYTVSGASANIEIAELNGHLATGSVLIDATSLSGGLGNITVVAGSSPVTWSSASTLILSTGGGLGNIAVNAPITGMGSGNLNLTAGGGAITQSAPIVNGGQLSAVGLSGVTLTNTGNDFATLAANTNSAPADIGVTDASAITLGAIGAGDDFSLTTGGVISQLAAASVSGATHVMAAGNPINLPAPTNDFVGPVSFTGSDVALRDANGLTLGGSTATGSLTVLPGGTLGQSGALAVGTTTTISTTGTTNFANAGNDFTGNVFVTGPAGNTTLADANALTLGSSQVTGLLHVLAGQGGGANSHVTQAAASTLTVNGPTTVEVGGASSDLILDNANALNGVIGIAGGPKVRDLKLRSTSAGASLNGLPPAPRDVAITFNSAPVPLTTSTVSGALTVLAGGPITETGSGLDVGGSSSFTAGANPITLTTAGNDFTGAVALGNTGANDAKVADDNALTLGSGSIGRDLTATAGTVLTVPGSAAIGAGGAGTYVTDDDAATAPAIGSGGITIGAGAAINSGGPLAIYTARRSQNSIAPNAMLNGAPFTPGTEFADTAREVWNTRFPAGTAQSPFTIFYKDRETTPPQTSIDSGPAAGSTITNRTPTFTFSADDAGATFECAVDTGDFAPCTSPITLGPLGDGTHSFTVRATDALGNVEPSPAQRSFTVDTTAPDTTLTKTPKKTVKTKKRKAKVAFGFASSQPDATFECSLDGVAYSPCTSPKAYKVAKGPHFFLLRSGDPAGNKDDTPARYDFKVKRKKKKRRHGKLDTAAPDATFIKTPDKRVFTTKRSVAVEFTFLSNAAGSHFECAREGGTFEPCSSPLVYRVGEGWHFIMVKAIDRSGNADPSPDDYLFKVKRARKRR